MDVRSFLIEKAISLPLILALVTLLSTEWTLMAFIVLGQAHFSLAYLYRYTGAGFSGKGLFLYFLILIPVMILAFFSAYEILIITSTVLFLLHAAWDEIFLVQKKPSLLTTLEIAPVVLLYTGLLFDSLYLTHVSILTALLGICILSIYGVVGYTHNHRFTFLSIYFLGGTAILSFLLLFGANIPYEKLVGVIILLHYSTWYVRYFMKIQRNILLRNTYLWRALTINIIFVGLGFVYIQTKDPILALLFSYSFFYAWTIMHIITSYRKNEYARSFQLTQP